MKRPAAIALVVALGLGLGYLVARQAKHAAAPAAPHAVTLAPEPRLPGHGATAPEAEPANEAAIEPAPGVIIDDHERVYHARPADEWQGMLVELTMQAECETSAQCGLAMQCRANHRCGPCERDADCGSGEQCSMDHCVKRELASCRTRRDCASNQMCVLSGYSSDPRGNSDMRAACLGTEGASPFPAEPDEGVVANPSNPADETVGARALLNDLMKDEPPPPQ